jgi:hypothetical protein
MTLKERFDSLGGIAPVKGKQFIPVSPAEIAELERATGGELPELYRSFLQIFGGSSLRQIVEFAPVEPLPVSVSSSGRGTVDVFYGAAAHAPNDLGGMLAVYHSRMPEHFLPIASDGGGNQIAMLVSGDDAGAIFHWDHNNEWDEDDYIDLGLPIPPRLKWQNVTLIAHSFHSFLERLSLRCES